MIMEALGKSAPTFCRQKTVGNADEWINELERVILMHEAPGSGNLRVLA